MVFNPATRDCMFAASAGAASICAFAATASAADSHGSLIEVKGNDKSTCVAGAEGVPAAAGKLTGNTGAEAVGTDATGVAGVGAASPATIFCVAPGAN